MLPDAALDAGAGGGFEIFLHPHGRGVGIRPAQRRLDTAGGGPGQPVPVGVERHFLHILDILSNNRADQRNRDAHAHQGVDAIVDPGEAVLHPADRFVHLVV